MALVPPLPSHPSLDYTILKPFVNSDPSRFILGPSLTEVPAPINSPFSGDGFPLKKAIHLQSWYSSASTGKSLRTWPSTSEAYLTWLDRVEAAFSDFWREVGIYAAIQLSRHPPVADNLLLAAALCFWSSTSNVFLFKRGPLIPTLLDVAAITGLRPHGVSVSMSYNPDGVSDFEDCLDLNDLAYSKFIRKFAGESPAPVTKNEHTAFLLYWLCHNIFCTRSQKINRDFVPIAVGLSNGDRLALGPYFLAFVYREIFDSIKILPSGDDIAISSGCGVFWFLQMFLQFYIPALCQSPFNPTSVAQFDSYG
uniref:Aminotransferase-like plant mobile domain-containing protein n=1 Tax=Ananas comosus var. bracteatus TaxID=296719 RepID=A0A6V7NVY7_ANACO|nr:unnamed protein product [Ananas comosus var. bracteatus]